MAQLTSPLVSPPFGLRKHELSPQMKLCQVKNLKVNCQHHYLYTEKLPSYCEAHYLFIHCLFLIHTYVDPSGQERMSPPPYAFQAHTHQHTHTDRERRATRAHT